MGKKSASGMNISVNFSKSLEIIFVVKIPEFFDADPDPGSGIRNLLDPGFGIEKIWIRDKPSRIRNTDHSRLHRNCSTVFCFSSKLEKNWVLKILDPNLFQNRITYVTTGRS
jgi:hypothetical protein